MTSYLNMDELQILSRCPLFCGIEPAELEALLGKEGCTVMDFDPGAELPGDGMMILLSNRVLIEKPVSDGRSLLMREALPTVKGRASAKRSRLSIESAEIWLKSVSGASLMRSIFFSCSISFAWRAKNPA